MGRDWRQKREEQRDFGYFDHNWNEIKGRINSIFRWMENNENT